MSYKYRRIRLILIRSKEDKQAYRINYNTCVSVLSTIGYNTHSAEQFTDAVFKSISKSYELILGMIKLGKSEFAKILTDKFVLFPSKQIKNITSYFFAIIRLKQTKEGLIILLGGASGTGKSSLTSLLAERLNMRVISTDNIRHILRNFSTKEDNPFIFASTYTADTLVHEEGLTQNEKILKGYKLQCEKVQAGLDIVLEGLYKSGGWVIVEGVHLTPDYITKCMHKFKNSIGSVIYIRNKENHKKRFIVRSDKHSIDPADNAYIKNIDKIRLIQKSLTDEAIPFKIPSINNTNLDSSFVLVHKVFLTTFKILKKHGTLMQGGDNTLIYNEFEKIKEKFTQGKKIKDNIKKLKHNQQQSKRRQEEEEKLEVEVVQPPQQKEKKKKQLTQEESDQKKARKYEEDKIQAQEQQAEDIRIETLSKQNQSKKKKMSIYKEDGDHSIAHPHDSPIEAKKKVPRKKKILQKSTDDHLYQRESNSESPNHDENELTLVMVKEEVGETEIKEEEIKPEVLGAIETNQIKSCEDDEDDDDDDDDDDEVSIEVDTDAYQSNIEVEILIIQRLQLAG